MSFFLVDNYRDVIRLKIRENDALRGYQSRLAESAGCHSSYLSQVLKGQVNLTPDQGIAFCEFWEFDDLQSDYFLTLLNLERAGTERLRNKLKSDLQRVREESFLVSNRLKRHFPDNGRIPHEHAMVYFSDWHYPAIKEALAIPGLRTVPALATRLGLPELLVAKALERLQDMRLVRRDPEGEGWKDLGVDISEFADEMLVKSFHSALRTRAMSRIELRRKGIDAHFGGIFTVEKQDLPLIKQLLGDLVNDLHELKKDSQPEELVCLCFDFFLM